MIETQAGGFLLSDDIARFDLACAHGWIGGESYWAAGIPFAVFERSVRGSLTVGAYDAVGAMAAMARAVTDRATFAWICDVFVDAAYRSQGLGEGADGLPHGAPGPAGPAPHLHLATRDAHGLSTPSSAMDL